MSETPIVDLHRWRAARRPGDAAGPSLAAGSASPQPSSPAEQVEQAATVLHLPPAPVRPAPDAPRSVFGPVMAFGLKPRQSAPRPAAVGEESAGSLSPRSRALKPRHLWDSRGATRGPGR